MNIFLDQQMRWVIAVVFGFLTLASCVGLYLKSRVQSESGKAAVSNLNLRIRSWWVMCILIGVALGAGKTGVTILFALVSFRALREFITLTPTNMSDHRALFWVFFIITPLQYVLVHIEWYGLFSILIPVYAFLFIPIRNAISGDSEKFLERTAKIQWGLMICVYCVSHVPALLSLNIPGYEDQNVKLVFFLVLVVQLSDVLQYVWGKTLGKKPIAPHISPNKTWAGFVGGVVSASLVGASLWSITPFNPWQAMGMSLIITFMGFAGGLTMSAIKRDRGVKDYGNFIPGHGGVMDRIDSLCFAAPIFFHLTRYYFTS
jgi:phosphatidate cytidylyltransferase